MEIVVKNDDQGVHKPDIAERTAIFAEQIIRVYRKLEHDGVGRTLGHQLLRSGTGIGANVQEAQGGQSKADFIAKMSIAYKETRETLYWLRLLKGAISAPNNNLSDLIIEANHLARILSSILITSKKSLKHR